MFRIGFRKVYYFNIRIISSVFMLENRMKYIYHMVMYVEDAILEKMKNHPSDELGRDLLFVRFFCLKMKYKERKINSIHKVNILIENAKIRKYKKTTNYQIANGEQLKSENAKIMHNA